jgi:hypothetical protein
MLIVFVQMQDLRSQLQEIIPEQQVVTRYIIYCTTVIPYFLLLHAIMCEKLLNSCLKIISNRFSSCSPPCSVKAKPLPSCCVKASAVAPESEAMCHATVVRLVHRTTLVLWCVEAAYHILDLLA